MKTLTLAALALTTLTGAAQAADMPYAKPSLAMPEMGQSPWYLHVGPMGVLFNSSAKLKLNGVPQAGVGAKANDNFTGGIELGYLFTPNLGASLTVGVPPVAKLNGTGGLAGNRIGSATYGPAVLTAHYHFTNFGPLFRPYVGAGVNYTIILGQRDGLVQNLKVKSGVGAVLQVGFESYFTKNWGVFVDVKKIFLSTDATGTVGPFAAKARVRLDPTIIQTGVTYRF